MWIEILTAIGTLLLALAAFAEIHNSTKSRQLNQLERDIDQLAQIDEKDFPATARRTFQRWISDPRSRYLIQGMLDDYEARRLLYHQELFELRDDLLNVRRLLVSAHPEIDDAGWTGNSLIAESFDPTHNTLARFDELAAGAALDLDYEWRGGTRYEFPPGSRDVHDEEPASETQMLELLEARRNRLVSLQQRGDLTVDSTFLAAYESVKRQWNEVHGAFVDWKQDHSEAALHSALLVLRSWTASTRESQRLDLDHPSLQGDVTGMSLHFQYHDYLISTGNPDAVFVQHSPIQEEMLFALSGLMDRHRKTSNPIYGIVQAIINVNFQHNRRSNDIDVS